MGIRFIAINDHYDSAEENDDKGRILIPFNNLINDTYCRDISMRVRSHLDVKRKEGQFIGSFAGYGYQKDPKDKNHLIIDEYAAGIVQEIFKLKLNGMSAQHIANHLNELGVLPPNEYKRASGFNYTCGFRAGLNQKWTVVSVNRILKNESYTGTLIQGKRRKINYKIKKSQDVGTENWIRVEGTHDAIISRGEFQQVQQLMELDIAFFKQDESVSIFRNVFAFEPWAALRHLLQRFCSLFKFDCKPLCCCRADLCQKCGVGHQHLSSPC